MLRLSDIKFDGTELWRPISGAQLSAMHSQADMLFFGGSAGGGKSALICADAIQERALPSLRALIIRRSFPEMTGLLDMMADMYKPLGATWSGQSYTWKFPSSAQVRLGYLSDDRDVDRYRGIPFSYLGVDESTTQTEQRIRRLLPWLRSTDKRLFVRIRLAANPGGIGGAWHKDMFLRGACPVHQPDKCVKPGVLYRGSKWPSDKKPLGMTVSFIPARVTDHSLLGDEYVQKLRMQEGAIAEQLLEGCFCLTSGNYFSFLVPSYLVPLAEAEEQWWETHFMACDYGYSGSAAAGGLFTRKESGHIYQVGEIIEKKMAAVEFAGEMCKRFAAPLLNGERRRISACYLGPDSFRHTGTGMSIADQMMEVFEKYDIPLMPAANDRVGGWQRVYSLMQNRYVMCTDACPQTFKALSTRVHDPKKTGDLIKVVGEDLDDAADMFRYGINTFFEDTTKPGDVAFLERLKKMKDSGATEHTLWIEQQRRMLQAEEEDTPIYLGRAHGRSIRPPRIN